MPETDLNLLTALDALLAEGSVAGAARRLGLSASAMSRTLARLRDATGDALLVRAGRGLVPTPHAVRLRQLVPELAHQARAVLQPAAAGLDLATLDRRFTLRANEGFVEAFASALVAAVAAAAPAVRLHFAPKPDKDVRALREGLVDLEIGVPGQSGPEVLMQALFTDRFVGAARRGHPLLNGAISAARYAACGHVVASRRGLAVGQVDTALAALGLARRVVVVVPGFPAALAIARESDLLALVPGSFLAVQPDNAVDAFALPVATAPITVAQMWHPRLDGDPALRWLRGLVREVCRSQGRPATPAPPPAPLSAASGGSAAAASRGPAGSRHSR